jgi:pimeloyl-ACP methyl ester carboxylesterase
MIGSVTADGCALYYEESGDGMPILLVHPAGATASTWARLPAISPASDE